MRSAYHYTPERIFDRIKAEEVLRPSSGIVSGNWKIPKDIFIPREKYTFALLDEPEPESWKESGFMDLLMNKLWAKSNVERGLLRSVFGGAPNYVLVSFPVEGSEAYVLDSQHLVDNKSLKDDEMLEKYLNSMVPLEDYENQYSMPELAVGSEIPLDLITVVEVRKCIKPKWALF